MSFHIRSRNMISFRLTKDPLLPNWFFRRSQADRADPANVLNNAVKFTSEGEVKLDVHLVAKENDKHHILFTIRDTGIGMSEDR